eukprot:365802-Chlamydomonas_euryale.AAC.22
MHMGHMHMPYTIWLSPPVRGASWQLQANATCCTERPPVPRDAWMTMCLSVANRAIHPTWGPDGVMRPAHPSHANHRRQTGPSACLSAKRNHAACAA